MRWLNITFSSLGFSGGLGLFPPPFRGPHFLTAAKFRNRAKFPNPFCATESSVVPSDKQVCTSDSGSGSPFGGLGGSAAGAFGMSCSAPFTKSLPARFTFCPTFFRPLSTSAIRPSGGPKREVAISKIDCTPAVNNCTLFWTSCWSM